MIPPGMDQVVIGDVQRTRLKLKALFFVGANDTLLPGNMGQGGLLTERDREWFQKEKQALSPGAKEKDVYSEILSVYESDQTGRVSSYFI